MMNEFIVSAATLLVGGNVVSAVAWARERVKSKLATKTLDDYEKLVELNDNILYEKFQEMGPAITEFLKKHPGLVPFSALSGVEFTQEQMEGWITKNDERLSEGFKQNLLKTSVKAHSWSQISKTDGFQLRESKIPVSAIVEKCSKCGLIHRYCIPASSSDDGFYFGHTKTDKPPACTY